MFGGRRNKIKKRSYITFTFVAPKICLEIAPIRDGIFSQCQGFCVHLCPPASYGHKYDENGYSEYV